MKAAPEVATIECGVIEAVRLQHLGEGGAPGLDATTSRPAGDRRNRGIRAGGRRPALGRTVSGPLAATRIVHVNIFRFASAAFAPDTRLVS